MLARLLFPLLITLSSFSFNSNLSAQVSAIPLNQTNTGERWDFKPRIQQTISPTFLEAQVLVGQDIILTGETDSFGIELFKFNHATQEIELFLDLEPGPGSSKPYGFVRVGDKFLFHAETAATGREIYVSDGTAAGTRMVEFVEGPYSSLEILRRGDAIYGANEVAVSFIVRTVENGSATLGIYNSELDDVVLVSDVNSVNQVLPLSDRFFVTTSFNGLYHVFFDGTSRQIQTDDPSGWYRKFKDKLILAGQKNISIVDPMTGEEEIAYALPGQTFTLGDTTNFYTEDYLYFFSPHLTLGNELWRTDGTVAGTTCLDVNPGSGSVGSAGSAALREGFFLREDDIDGTRIMQLDTSTLTIGLLTNLPSSVSRIVAWNGSLVYSGITNGTLQEYDPSQSQFRMLGSAGSNDGVFNYMYPLGDYLLAKTYGDSNLSTILFQLDCSSNVTTDTLSFCKGESLTFMNNEYTSSSIVQEQIDVYRGCDTFKTTFLVALDTPLIGVTGPDTITVGGVAQFESTYGIVSWPDGSMDTTFNLPTSDLDPGIYSFTVQALDTITGCSSIATFSIEVKPMVSSTFSLSQSFRLSPNPAREAINLLDFQQGDEWGLYDALGSHISSGIDPQVDVRMVPVGVYYLRVSSGGSTITKKVLVQ